MTGDVGSTLRLLTSVPDCLPHRRRCVNKTTASFGVLVCLCVCRLLLSTRIKKKIRRRRRRCIKPRATFSSSNKKVGSSAYDYVKRMCLMAQLFFLFSFKRDEKKNEKDALNNSPGRCRANDGTYTTGIRRETAAAEWLVDRERPLSRACRPMLQTAITHTHSGSLYLFIYLSFRVLVLLLQANRQFFLCHLDIDPVDFVLLLTIEFRWFSFWPKRRQSLFSKCNENIPLFDSKASHFLFLFSHRFICGIIKVQADFNRYSWMIEANFDRIKR